MIEIKAKSKCSGCHACAAICPNDCIRMVADEEGFWYPQIDKTQCIGCNLCEKVCPILRACPSTTDKVSAAYAALHKDESIRLKSSSGGIFTAIASHVLSQGGVVFGAAFNEQFEVEHTYVERIEDLQKFRGSKYVQSKIGDTYKQAKEFLKEGRLVLFTGTPCQIGGLLSFLGKDYKNLITQDIICHGVPSPLAWEEYLKYRRGVAEEPRIKNIAFRAKDDGWKRFSMSFTFEKDIRYRQTLDKDPMMQAFLKNLCLRPSCYECAFKNKVRASDITLADFWGIEKVMPEMDDDKGTSLVIVHSEKGKILFENIQETIICKKVDLDSALAFNTMMTKSVALPKNRAKFMRNIQSKNFALVVKKYAKPKFLQRLKNKIKRILRR